MKTFARRSDFLCGRATPGGQIKTEHSSVIKSKRFVFLII